MTKGQIYHALAQKDVQRIRPLFAFVPDALVSEAGLDREKYVTKRWASINAGANADAVGSHVFPDMARPATEKETVEFRAGLARLIHKSQGVASPMRKPGRAGMEI